MRPPRGLGAALTTEFYLWPGFKEVGELGSVRLVQEGLAGKLTGSGKHTDVTSGGLTPSVTQTRWLCSAKNEQAAHRLRSEPSEFSRWPRSATSLLAGDSHRAWAKMPFNEPGSILPGTNLFSTCQTLPQRVPPSLSPKQGPLVAHLKGLGGKQLPGTSTPESKLIHGHPVGLQKHHQIQQKIPKTETGSLSVFRSF